MRQKVLGGATFFDSHCIFTYEHMGLEIWGGDLSPFPAAILFYFLVIWGQRSDRMYKQKQQSV